MKITSVEARAIDCGFQSQKLQTSRVASPMSRWPQYGEHRASWMWPTQKVFVRIESSDGLVGWSCTNGGEVVATIVQAHLSRLLVGSDASNIAELWDQMFYSLLPSGRSGFSMMAIAGVDIALWDLKARTEQQSLYQLLGGKQASTRLPVYATTSQPGVSGQQPYWGLKAAMPYAPADGYEGLQGNVQHLENFRTAAGSMRPIMLDAFMAWDTDYTLRLNDAAGHVELYWVEDPLPPFDLEGLQRLRAEAGDNMRLALGNFCFNRWDCAELIRENLVDILQPDVAWAGGITECLRILHIAKDAGVPVILHNTCEQPWAVAMAAACQQNAIIEFVDRGETSRLYGLMGTPPDTSSGTLQVRADHSGNQPPDFVKAQFIPHADTQTQNTEKA